MSVHPSLHSVSFDLRGFTPRPSEPSVRAWTMLGPEGDGAGIYFFAIPPDIPPSRDLGELRAQLDARMGTAGAKRVEVSLLDVDGCRALKMITKVPQTPHGLTFVAGITIPFRDFSFVLKGQFEERGTTGIRETVLLTKYSAAGGTMSFTEDGRMLAPGFDPDNEQFDAEFPAHPLSRARRFLHHVTATVRVDPALKKLAPFAGIPA